MVPAGLRQAVLLRHRTAGLEGGELTDMSRKEDTMRGLSGNSLSAALRPALVATVMLMAGPLAAGDVKAAGDAPAIEAQSWSFNGVFGTFDRASVQRGFQVYKEVCSSCHSLKFLSYRNLSEPGGPEFPEAQVKVIAADVEVQDGPNEDGDMFDRPGRPSDRFVSPFPNENAARSANAGALPPDLSVIAKARAHGPDYLYALLTGYKDAPAGMEVAEGMSYNAAFPGHQIAMAAPLSEDSVEYGDGTKATVPQMAKDVSQFLMWAAEPKLEERKRIGFQVMIYLIILAGLLYFTTKKLWSRIEH